MGDRHFRLSSDVRPVSYTFVVSPDVAGGVFLARGEVRFETRQPTRAVVMHAVALDFDTVQIDGVAATATLEADSQTVTFELTSELAPGSHRLEVAYRGRLHDDLRGFYKAGDIGVTQFEAADARRAFPCFDEPAFKATWSLSLEVPADSAAVSNGAVVETTELPDGRRRVRFATTPIMSSYLVAMVVGRLVPSEARKVGPVALRTWAQPGKEQLTGFAQECAGDVLPLLEQYFDRPYAFGKLDQLAIPDFEAGAMENSGCITFREILLLVDRASAPLAMQKRVAEVITHELAHQWFGNLVTMHWWDDLWLNEAFATWIAYKIVHAWRPGWRMWDDFEAGKQAALQLDAMESTHPVRAEVLCAEEATENFDLITYEKGGAMLRMIEGFLGEEPFRAGIRDYMQRHAFGNAAADDLWGALGRAAGRPVSEVANGWLGRGGFPLVTLRREGGSVRLSQQRFFNDPARLAATSDDAPWLVPVVLRWADDAGIHRTAVLLRDREAVIELPIVGALRWVLGNADGAGFYRVDVGDDGTHALLSDWSELTPVERVCLLSDSWALYRAQRLSFATLVEVLLAGAADADHAVLADAVGRLEGWERRYAAAEALPALRARVAERCRPHLAAVGWEPAADEGDDARLRRAAALRGLIAVARDPAVCAEAVARLQRRLSGDDSALDANLLDVATLAAARSADATWFDATAHRAVHEADPVLRRRALVALASVESPALVDRAIAAFATDVVPKQDSTTFLGALLANRAARESAWRLIRDQWSVVREKTSAPMLTRRLVESMVELFERRSEVEALWSSHADSLAAVPAALRQTRERIGLEETLLPRARADLSAWLAAE